MVQAVLNSFLLVAASEMGDKTQLLAFSLAARSGRSIIPISIVGTRNTLPKKTRHIQGGLVTIHVGSPITVPEVTTREAERNLMEHVRQIISNTVDSYV